MIRCHYYITVSKVQCSINVMITLRFSRWVYMYDVIITSLSVMDLHPGIFTSLCVMDFQGGYACTCTCMMSLLHHWISWLSTSPDSLLFI